MHLSEKFQLKNESEPFDAFASSPEKYDANGFTANMLSRPFGTEPRNVEEIEEMIKMIDSDFSVVLINEYFEESLLLMQEKLCMDFSDLFYVNLKVMTYRAKQKQYQKKVLENHRNWSLPDYVLYSYFKQKLIKSKRMTAKLNLLKAVNGKIENICKNVCRTLENVTRRLQNVSSAIEYLVTAISIKEGEFAYEFAPLDCLQYIVDEDIMINTLISIQSANEVTTRPVNQQIMLEICKHNGLCLEKNCKHNELCLNEYCEYYKHNSHTDCIKLDEFHIIRYVLNLASAKDKFTFPMQFCTI